MYCYFPLHFPILFDFEAKDVIHGRPLVEHWFLIQVGESKIIGREIIRVVCFVMFGMLFVGSRYCIKMSSCNA